MASAMLLLPLPFGPTTAATPGGSSRLVRLAKDLNPCRLRDFRNKARRLPHFQVPSARSMRTHKRRSMAKPDRRVALFHSPGEAAPLLFMAL